jgi:hypothetical protein
LLTARSLKVVDATRDAQQFLTKLSFDDCFDPPIWRKLLFFGQIIPDGDILPVRAPYGVDDSFTIGINPLRTEFPLWYTGADLVASKLLSGRAPKVIKAYRLVAEGQQAGLRPIKLRGAIDIDPRDQDFFRVVVEQHKRLDDKDPTNVFLKVLANAGAYGIFAEIRRYELPPEKVERLKVYGLRGLFTAAARAPEEAGPFCFPPIASSITGGARLMLCLLERCVTDAGGRYAFCDTDSMAIVANEEGSLVPCPNGPYEGHIKALSWNTVDQIVSRFVALNPYDAAMVPGSILKIEKENLDEQTKQRRQLYCYAISAKRYALFNR